jgi:RimJ/RimL family protein N-acetyltransferase
MLHKLPSSDYERARPLFGALRDYHLCIDATLDGVNPGSVYTDDPGNPQGALMFSVEGTFLAGNPDNGVFNAAVRRTFHRLLLEDDEVSVLFVGVNPAGWRDRLPDLFPSRPLTIQRQHYVCTALAVDWRARVPEGFAVRRIDRALLDTPGLQVPEHIRGWLAWNWGSTLAFLMRGFGFCTVYGDRVVSWSICDCASGNACEIGIHTLPEFRRRGLATVTAAAAVDYALSHGWDRVGWHCDANNPGSIRTAITAGFRHERDYVFHVCMADQAGQSKAQQHEETRQ